METFLLNVRLSVGPSDLLVLLVLLAVGALYTVGWWQLRARSHWHLAKTGRLLAYLGGLTALGVAFLPPVATFETRFFSIHMIQHELLIEIAPSLLWLGNPILFLLWGLPGNLRNRLGRRLLSRRSSFRRWLRLLTSPRIVLVAYIGTVVLWHLPPIYDAGIRYAWLHVLEHASLLGTALLFWWYVTGTPPHIHAAPERWLSIGYLLVAYAQNEVLGVGLTLVQQSLYASHQTGFPHPWGLSPLQDQSLGGAIMWIPGEFIYAGSIMTVLMRLLDEGEPIRGVFEFYPTDEGGTLLE